MTSVVQLQCITLAMHEGREAKTSEFLGAGMEAETQNRTTVSQQSRSKRLSSFIWILVLWVFVRLIAGMDGISWTRAFDGISIWLGLWPSTCLLLLATLPQAIRYQSLFRKAALFMVIGSFIIGIVLIQVVENIQKIHLIEQWIQYFSLFFVIVGVGVYAKLNKGEKV